MEAVFVKGQYLNLAGQHLVIEKKLGNGAFGVVYKVRKAESGQPYALKDIQCQNTSAIHEAIREVQTLLKVNHNNVLNVVGADQYRTRQNVHVLILTEFCSGGNLNERLCRGSSQQTNVKWMTQLASALSHLHDHNIVHRDLKPENVLLTDPQTDDIKIGDFGLAREYLALKCTDVSKFVPFIETFMQTTVGTIYWMAPEVFNYPYTEKADVFSLGCIFYAILVRKYVVLATNGERYYGVFVSPEPGRLVGLGEAMAKRNQRFMVDFPADSPISRSLRKITMDALQLNPSDRPSAREVYDRCCNPLSY